MFYEWGVVIPDQFDHLKFILFRSFREEKNGVLGIWEVCVCVWGWGGPLSPKENVKILAKF